MVQGIINWIATTEFKNIIDGEKVFKKITFMLPENRTTEEILLTAQEKFKELGYWTTTEDIKIERR